MTYTEAELKTILEKHQKWLNGEPDGKRANLEGANLEGADLDFSCWPLWCGSLDVKVGARIAAQLAYHFCRLKCDDTEYIEARNAIVDFANRFHRADERRKLEKR